MKLFKQILLLVAVALCFAVFNFAVFSLCTQRCLPDNGVVEKTRVIKLDQYLPFDVNSKIVHLQSDLTLSGELPVLDGAEGLYPVFSAVAEALYPESAVSFDGESFTPQSCLQMNNTLRAYKGVVDGSVDLIFCAGPSEEQLAYSAEQGVELELVPIGREAFVFLVQKDNPVDNLTTEQIRGIYSGKYSKWSELGGRDLRISALRRLAGSGSQTALLAFMGDEKIVKDYDSFLGSAIGFSFRYYVADVIENGGVKMLAVNGAYPSQENISNGSYPIVSQFYAVYDKANDNPNLPLLLDWLLSAEGQRLIEETGYVPLQ